MIFTKTTLQVACRISLITLTYLLFANYSYNPTGYPVYVQVINATELSHIKLTIDYGKL